MYVCIYVSVVALKNELRNSSRIPVRELDLKFIFLVLK
jgi:hypothetical protein